VTVVQINPMDKKMISSTKSTIFSSFCKNKQGQEMVLLLMWYVDHYQIFKNVSQEYKDTPEIIYSFMNIYLLSMWYHQYLIQLNSCKVVSLKHTDINNINIRMQIKK